MRREKKRVVSVSTIEGAKEARTRRGGDEVRRTPRRNTIPALESQFATSGCFDEK